MVSSRADLARRAVAGAAAVIALCVGALTVSSAAQADPWWAETTQASVSAGETAVPDALDRYVANLQGPLVVSVLTPVPAASADSGFQIDWANIGIGVGAALVGAVVVASAVVVGRHGRHHGGPGRPVTHG